ncbi:MAG: bifunctional adenosylcobinamide kinase/adenosylcobinamide-phosphate guanylyltransferase [Alphaproteobacteria bacterium]|nr:bifunctional adenosylcobinamide kinase/adenosylcobinamide-phosphate guanylyltransferase [Alphaproteobacteria bacterium]
MTVTLVLGGARSGKSRFAEKLAYGAKHYVATAQAFDDEMKQRIASHQKQRGDNWVTHEVPFDLVWQLKSIDAAGKFILVDCLTLWLSNLLLAEADCADMVADLVLFLKSAKAQIVVVSNEVGLSIVPDTALGRAFRDIQGIANQGVAAVADNVVFVAAGLPLLLKGAMPQAGSTPTE